MHIQVLTIEELDQRRWRLLDLGSVLSLFGVAVGVTILR